jgi:hypothetical protein
LICYFQFSLKKGEKKSIDYGVDCECESIMNEQEKAVGEWGKGGGGSNSKFKKSKSKYM